MANMLQIRFLLLLIRRMLIAANLMKSWKWHRRTASGILPPI